MQQRLAGISHLEGMGAIGIEDLRAIESIATDPEPEVKHAIKEILLILTMPTRRDEIRINDTHYRLHHRPAMGGRIWP